MLTWTLRPIDHHEEIWDTYVPFRQIVVRGRNEDDAREEALRATFGGHKLEREGPAGPLKKLPPSPWEDPAKTSCEAADGHEHTVRKLTLVATTSPSAASGPK